MCLFPAFLPADIESNAFIIGTNLQAGWCPENSGHMTLSKTTVGKGCTLLAQSIVSPGTSLPAGYILTPGTTSARPPMGPSSQSEHEAVRTEPGPLPAVLWVTATVTLLIVFSFAWLAIVPAIAVWWSMNQDQAAGWRELLAAALNCWLQMPLEQEPICRYASTNLLEIF